MTMLLLLLEGNLESDSYDETRPVRIGRPGLL